jgi:hypothetical protein
MVSLGSIPDAQRSIPGWGGVVTDPPGEYPYMDRGSYLAVYFRGPDDIKLECLYMSELARLHGATGALHGRLWLD